MRHSPRQECPKFVTCLFVLIVASAACDLPFEPSKFATLPPPSPPPAPPPAPPNGTAVFVPAPADPGTVPDGSSSPLGRYRLDLTLGDTTDPDCGFLPDEAKSRTYSAAVTFTLPLGFRVVLGDATFLGSPTCDSPEAGPGDSICHWLRYEFDGLGNEGVWLGFDPTPFVEQLSDGSWLQLTGAPYGPETSGGVNASGAIVAWHWPTDGGVVRHCDAPNARITLIRQ